MNVREIDAVISGMKLFEYKSGEFACREHEIGFHFFVIATGDFAVTKPSGTKEDVQKLDVGYAFGEGVFVQQGLELHSF